MSQQTHLASDMRNVNNWHWVNKDCRSWAKNYWEDQIVGLEIRQKDGLQVTIDRLEKCTGDVDLNQRKGKLLAIYDMALEFGWNGRTSSGHGLTGTIQIPEVAYDTDMEDYVFDIHITHGHPKEIDAFKHFIRTQLVPIMRKKLSQFTTDLIQNYSADLYVGSSQPIAQQQTVRSRKASKQETVIQTTQLKLSYTIPGVSAEDVYETLLDAERATVWSKGKVKVSKTINSEFSLFDGNVHGRQLKLIPGRLIGEAWRLKHWPKDHYSTVSFDFKQENDNAVIHIEQRGIPSGQEDTVRQNWINYYWKPIEACYHQHQFVEPVAYNSNQWLDSSIQLGHRSLLALLFCVLLIGLTAYFVAPFLQPLK